MKNTFTVLIFLISFSLSKAQSPTFSWAKQFGSFGVDDGRSITTDASGNVYTTGEFGATVDFDPGPGTFTMASSGSSDIFISKLDANGNFVWAKKISGPNNESGYSIALDFAGNILLTGYFQGVTDFDPGIGTYTLSSTSGSSDIFICKLDGSGNFIWAKQFVGGNSTEIGISIASDLTGNVYTTGYFQGVVDFDPGISTYTLSKISLYYEMFVSKLDGAGNFVWAKQLNGPNSDQGTCVKIDGAGNVLVSGSFAGLVDFDPSPSTYTINSFGNSDDAFVSKLDAAGNFIWAKQLGGISYDNATSVTSDASGNIYSTGIFSVTADFDPNVGTYTLSSFGNTDVFVSKLDASGNFVWAKQIGGPSGENGTSISIDASSNIYLAGAFSGVVDFDPSPSTFTLSGNSVFISKLDGAGNFGWATQLSGPSGGNAYSMSTDNSGNVYTTGWFGGTMDFDPGLTTYTLTSAGSTDAFVHKMSQSPAGIEEVENENQYKLYPNPNNGKFNVSLDKKHEFVIIRIFNSIGQIVMERTYLNGESLAIDISEQSAGLYFVEINLNEKTMRQKLIKN